MIIEVDMNFSNIDFYIIIIVFYILVSHVNPFFYQ